MERSLSNLLIKLNAKFLALVVFVSIFGGSLGALGYLYKEAHKHQETALRSQVAQLTSVAASFVNVKKHEQIVSPDQLNSKIYKNTIAPLIKLHLNTPEIHYLYTMRVDDDGKEWFVLDTATDKVIQDLLVSLGRDVEPSGVMEPYETPENDGIDKADEMMREGQTFVFDFPYVDSYGSFVSAQTPLFDNEGNYVGYVGVDYDLETFKSRMQKLKKSGVITLLIALILSLIFTKISYTTRKEAAKNYRTMQLLKDEAEAAVRDKSDLLAIASHDLKNPLNAITGLSDIMLEERKSDKDTETYTNLQLISEAAAHMSALITGILSVEGLKHEKINKSTSCINFTLQIEKIVAFNASSAKKKNITINTQIDDNIWVEGDSGRLREASDNLVSNAVKYTPKGGFVNISLELVSDNQYAKLSVADNGPGLTQEDQSKLFRKFQKLSTKPTGGEFSTGLGLSLVKDIVEMHGGQVGCESKKGEGSVFWFTLPARDPKSDP